MPGLLVAFEGIDGAGKTTQVGRLQSLLGLAGIEFVSTKEPTKGPWGTKIRESAQHGRMSADDELDAFLRDRREHVRDLLLPELTRGRIVIVDRYYFSTVAYQGARDMNPAALLELNAFAPAPDVLIVLDVDPALGLRRIRLRGDSADLFEKEEELAKARQIFNSLTVPNLTILDGTTSPDVLARQIGTLVLSAWYAKHDVAALAGLDELLDAARLQQDQRIQRA